MLQSLIYLNAIMFGQSESESEMWTEELDTITERVRTNPLTESLHDLTEPP